MHQLRYAAARPPEYQTLVRLPIAKLPLDISGAKHPGRSFIGDHPGDGLYAEVLEFGLASGTDDANAVDIPALGDSMISDAVRVRRTGKQPHPHTYCVIPPMPHGAHRGVQKSAFPCKHDQRHNVT